MPAEVRDVNEQQPLAELDRVTHRFEGGPGVDPPEPLKDLSLQIASGESLSIAGPSGCGKTTLLQILGGLLRPTAGTARIEGRDLTTLSERELARLRNQKIGFVFQQHHLLPQCTLLENLLVPTLVQYRRCPPALIQRARDLLASVGLADRSAHRPAELSGGECQRGAVARALINQPVLLLADEPTGALDNETAHELGELLVRLNAEQGLTLVTVTHWEALAQRMQRTLRLSGGRLDPVEQAEQAAKPT